MRIAIIPASGSSKRIPLKNIKEFHGRPIISYAMDCAKESGFFDKIIVSTDNDKIAEIADKYGNEDQLNVEVLKTPEETHTSVFSVVRYSILETNKTFQVDEVCVIYPCNPFLSVDELISSYNKLKLMKYDFVIAVTSYNFNPDRALIEKNRYDEEDVLEVSAVDKEKIKRKSQDLPNYFHDAGKFYWGFSRSFFKYETIFGDEKVSVAAIYTPRWLVQDIDTEEDWKTAEMLYEKL